MASTPRSREFVRQPPSKAGVSPTVGRRSLSCRAGSDSVGALHPELERHLVLAALSPKARGETRTHDPFLTIRDRRPTHIFQKPGLAGASGSRRGDIGNGCGPSICRNVWGLLRFSAARRIRVAEKRECSRLSTPLTRAAPDGAESAARWGKKRIRDPFQYGRLRIVRESGGGKTRTGSAAPG